MTVLRFATHLWFDDQAEEAAKFYTSLFEDSRIDRVIAAPAGIPGGVQEGSGLGSLSQGGGLGSGRGAGLGENPGMGTTPGGPRPGIGGGAGAGMGGSGRPGTGTGGRR